MNLIKFTCITMNIILIAILIFLNSCVDEYWPEVLEKYENALVVDGAITSKEGPYEIKLSLSSEVGDPKFIPLEGCNVTISDSEGNIEQLSDESNGIYSTSKDGIQGIPGRSYRIQIQTPDGKKYQSDFAKMPQAGIIDDIHYKIEYQPHPILDRMINGLRFYISAHNENDSSNYFFWQIDQTYKFNANYKIKFYFDGQMHRFFNSDTLFTCYKNILDPHIFIFNTEKLSKAEIRDFPLNYVNTESKALSIRYSALFKQYSLTKENYEYWNNIASLNAEQDDLYSRLPFQIRGNVYNIENKDEPVLGCFMVAGLTEKRIYVNRLTELDYYYQDSCKLFGVDIELLYIHKNEWPIFLPAWPGTGGASPAWVDYQWCIDCTKDGGELEMPEFWQE